MAFGSIHTMINYMKSTPKMPLSGVIGMIQYRILTIGVRGVFLQGG